MNANPSIIATDCECLTAFSRERNARHLRPVVERYLSLVYSSALRRTGDTAQAWEVTRAVFLVLARRARKLRKKTVLAGWFFRITALACRKLGVKRRRWWHSFGRPRDEPSFEMPLWSRIASEIDAALERLPARECNAVLLQRFLNWNSKQSAEILGTNVRRIEKRTKAGMKKLAKRLRRWGATGGETLARTCVVEGCAALIPDGFAEEILLSIEECGVKKPALKLARRTLNTLAWQRWRRRFAIAIPIFILLFGTVAGAAWHIDSRSGHSRLISAFLIWSVKSEAKSVPGLAQPARPWRATETHSPLDLTSIRSAQHLYQTTNIWRVHLSFSREQWKALEPKKIGALPNFLKSDGTAILRHPKAQRSGLAGVLGYDFDWTHADFEFEGLKFTNVAARVKGNGTWLGSLYGQKRAFKVDLNKFAPGQKLASMDELTFNNMIADHSYMSDTLAYEFFREAGVPAPRTAYAWMTVRVEGKWDRKPLGLYVMIEPVDAEFVEEHFESRKTPVFKPVTYQLFEDLGDDWSSYSAIYDLKTKATLAQQRRVVDFAKLVSHASDEEFATRVGDFLDLGEFARFLAGMVLLSSYDGILSDGQNFYVYLDPRSNKFGFIPWDLDLAWGSFFLLGTKTERERASIWHPWVGQNRFLERVMAVEAFRQIYRAHLEDFSARLFVPAKLNQRIDELAAIVRDPVAHESDFRLDKFEQAIGTRPVKRAGDPMGSNRPAHELKRFIEKRAVSVRQQLDGKSKGVILKRRTN